MVDHSSSSHTNNQENDFLVLVEGPTQGINESTVTAEKNLVSNLKQRIASFGVIFV